MIYSSWKWVVLLPLLTKPVSFVFFGGLVSSLIILPFLYSQDIREWKGNINSINNMTEFYESGNSEGNIVIENYIRHPSKYTEVKVTTLIFSNLYSPQECSSKIRELLISIKKIQIKNIPMILKTVCVNRGVAIGRFTNENALISILPIHDKNHGLAGIKIRNASILDRPIFSKYVVTLSNTWLALIIIILSMISSYLLALVVGGYIKKINIYASIDGLTGCFRREVFYAKASYALEKAKKNNLPFSVLVIDLDRLREVNNVYGHAKGDTAISLIAKAMRKCLRSDDFVGRVGGDEFIVILRNTHPPESLLIANRIRQAVKDIKLDELSLTVSIGISQYDKDNAALQEIISKADANLYIAKRERNKVVSEDATMT